MTRPRFATYVPLLQGLHRANLRRSRDLVAAMAKIRRTNGVDVHFGRILAGSELARLGTDEACPRLDGIGELVSSSLIRNG